MTDDTLNATLIERDDLAPHLAIVRVRPEVGGIEPFEPGQFVQIGLPKHVDPPEVAGGRARLHKRSYSIASSPLEREQVELYLNRVDGGRFTPELWSLRPGDRLWMDPQPKGIFTLGNLPRDARLVLVATGTGLAPYVSMLRRWPASTAEPRWSRAVVIHGVRHPEELGYRSEIEARARTDPRVTYVPIVSRPLEGTTGSTWSGLVGRVQRVLEPEAFRAATGETLAPDRHHVFLCGNPDMIRDVRAQLEPLGFRLDTAREPGALHLEKYW